MSNHLTTSHGVRRFGLCLLTAAAAAAGCSLEKQSTPGLTGPSEFGLTITVVATPDSLPRDGASQSEVTATVFDVGAGRPELGRHLGVKASIGSVSETEIVTDREGRATFAYTAPAASVPGALALIEITPLVGNNANAARRTVSIRLTGIANTTLPAPDFSFSPAAPVLRETVAFDATDTTDEGVKCNENCTYAWEFGDGGTASGRLVTHAYTAVGTYQVKVTATDPAGSTASKTKTVAVTQGTVPTASYTFSPSSPGIYETVNFTAEASRVGQAGRTITSYEWRFGDGSTATGVTTTHSYSVIGTYPVVLTVTDSAGLQATTSQNVTVVNDVTASFTVSPTTVTLSVSGTAIVNAEGSKGSSGFGTRNPISKYFWNFGDATDVTETTSPVTSHTYARSGIFTINLTVEDSAGRRATTSKTVTVE